MDAQVVQTLCMYIKQLRAGNICIRGSGRGTLSRRDMEEIALTSAL